MEKLKKLDRRIWVILLSLVLFIGGFSTASYSEISGGTVKVDRIDFVTDEGYRMSAKLYVPQTATEDSPAPGILALPGGNASLENMSSVAIEPVSYTHLSDLRFSASHGHKPADRA